MTSSPPSRTSLPRPDASGLIDGAAAILRAAYSEASGEHASISLAYEKFASGAAVLARRRSRERADDAPSSHVLSGLFARPGAAADVYLAVACEEGAAGSWERLAEQMLPRLNALARSRGLAPGDAEDLARETIDDLSRPPPDGSARTVIGTYRGAGSLGGWLAVVLLRRLADLHRARKPALRLVGDGEEDAPGAVPSSSIAAGEPDPLERVLDREARDRLDRAFRKAWDELPPREALAVRLKYCNDLPLAAVGAVLGLGESRTCRVLQRAVDRLRASLERSLAGEGAWRRFDGSVWKGLEAAVGGAWQESAVRTDTASGAGS